MVLSKSSEEIQSKSWRSVLPVHPAAALLPPMSDAKLKELGEDIKAHGQQTSIVIFVDDKGKHWLLDGISRLEAMQRSGLQVIENNALNILVVDWQEIDDVDPIAYVLSANLHRRHLSARDKRELAGNLLEMFPSKSDRQIAEMVGLSHPTIKVVRAELETCGKIFHVETRIDTRKRKQPATKTPKPTSAAGTDPIHADHHHHDGGEHNQLAGRSSKLIGGTAAELEIPADQAAGAHHGADQRTAGALDGAATTSAVPSPTISVNSKPEKMSGSAIAAAFNLLNAAGVDDFLTLISPDHRFVLKRHFDERTSDSAKAEIAKLASESMALLTHPEHTR